MQSNLLAFLRTLKNVLDVIAALEFLPMQPGELATMHADTGTLQQWGGHQRSTPLEGGLTHFRQWYNSKSTIRPA